MDNREAAKNIAAMLKETYGAIDEPEDQELIAAFLDRFEAKVRAATMKEAAQVARNFCGHGKTTVMGGTCSALHSVADSLETKAKAAEDGQEKKG